MPLSVSSDDRKFRVFTLSPGFIDKYVGLQPKWGWNGLGYFTYKRTYARLLEGGKTEEWWQTCQRVVEGCFNIQKQHCRQLGLPWNDPKAQRSAQDMFQRMWDFKFTPPGRGLWMMGTQALEEKGAACLLNCAFVSTENLHDDFAGPFCYLMDMSMLGVGVGGDTRGAGKVKIQMPKLSDEVFVVEDSREGWVDLVKTILNTFVGKGQLPGVLDYSGVRARGALLATMGGTSSGPKPLHLLVVNLIKLLLPPGVGLHWEAEEQDNWATIGKVHFRYVNPEAAESYRITSTHIVDIFNYVGKAVVSGGIRRTAEIMFGEVEDQEFLKLKADLDALMDRRWASNNSIFGKVGMDYEPVLDGMISNGEPGIFWLENARKFSRMGHPADLKDRRASGANPCSEQVLESWEACNLVETYPAHHDSYEDFEKTLKMAYLYAKTVTLIPTHDPRANAVMMRNRRIGCSMSGITQAMAKLGRRGFLNWCDQGYEYIQKADRIYSDWLGVPTSIKTTSVKPSGTVSLLCGATPGIHFPHSEFYIRRVRVQNTSPLVEACRRAGYHVEKDSYADDTDVVSFPVHETNFIKGKSDVTIWEQFSNAAALQHHWADNMVSCTITFKKSEATDLRACLEMFETQMKSVSVLPLNDEDHGYVQAPYEAIDEATYLKMVAGIRPILMDDDVHDTDEKFCSGDKCLMPVRSK